jgi:hypothetical protein
VLFRSTREQKPWNMILLVLENSTIMVEKLSFILLQKSNELKPEMDEDKSSKDLIS